MNCPKCGERLYVVDSRQYGDTRWRRYRCPACLIRTDTYENMPPARTKKPQKASQPITVWKEKTNDEH